MAMGRGRAKAKQTKVARRLKYYTPEMDLESLQRELAGKSGQDSHDDGYDDYEDYDEYEDPYAAYIDDEDDTEDGDGRATGSR
ncbi:hypothetical protein CFRA_09965 [Corynebacterium frankenforstense DSM 45800]|uniref:DUF3073 domain-containing protein n=2 Tax=Corynebacteriaceae TaxID=1653 RepID=A0A1L7CUF9_9CORY|nr:hypothetical protein CFRA_09965 [Corynebacterium frankenforstense DSM 45800]